MGFAVRIKLDADRAANVNNAIGDLQAWVKTRGGHDDAYDEWCLANQMCIVKASDYTDLEIAKYVGVDECLPGEVLLFHHDMPWFHKLAPEVLEKARELFEANEAVDVWWLVLKESGEAADCLSSLCRELPIKLYKHESRK